MRSQISAMLIPVLFCGGSFDSRSIWPIRPSITWTPTFCLTFALFMAFRCDDYCHMWSSLQAVLYPSDFAQIRRPNDVLAAANYFNGAVLRTLFDAWECLQVDNFVSPNYRCLNIFNVLTWRINHRSQHIGLSQKAPWLWRACQFGDYTWTFGPAPSKDETQEWERKDG